MQIILFFREDICNFNNREVGHHNAVSKGNNARISLENEKKNSKINIGQKSYETVSSNLRPMGTMHIVQDRRNSLFRYICTLVQYNQFGNQNPWTLQHTVNRAPYAEVRLQLRALAQIRLIQNKLWITA